MIRILFDMDGTLATYLFGKPYEALFEKGYFEELPPNKNIIKAAQKLLETYTVGILSAYLPDSEYALEEKNTWLDKYNFPQENRYFLKYLASKGDYCTSETDVLVDDRSLHGEEWTAAGGKFVKVSTNRADYNKEKKRFKYVIYPQMPAWKIAQVIERCANGL